MICNDGFSKFFRRVFSGGVGLKMRFWMKEIIEGCLWVVGFIWVFWEEYGGDYEGVGCFILLK